MKKRTVHRLLALAIAAGLMLLASGCATPPRPDPGIACRLQAPPVPATARPAPPLGPPERHLFGLVHADLATGSHRTDNHLLAIVSRTATLALDELVIDAAFEVNAQATQLGFATHWAAATQLDCPGGGMFSPQRGACLWNAGLGRARDTPQPWRAFPDLGEP
jgi:hypothetical protein